MSSYSAVGKNLDEISLLVVQKLYMRQFSAEVQKLSSNEQGPLLPECHSQRAEQYGVRFTQYHQLVGSLVWIKLLCLTLLTLLRKLTIPCVTSGIRAASTIR